MLMFINNCSTIIFNITGIYMMFKFVKLINNINYIYSFLINQKNNLYKNLIINK